jgi:hypothetical protein
MEPMTTHEEISMGWYSGQHAAREDRRQEYLDTPAQAAQAVARGWQAGAAYQYGSHLDSWRHAAWWAGYFAEASRVLEDWEQALLEVELLRRRTAAAERRAENLRRFRTL